MKIYIVSHYWDNGLDYEDCQSYEEHYYFSTQEKAESAYYQLIVGDFVGKFTLVSVELDTGVNEDSSKETLDSTPYIGCPPVDLCDEDYECYPEMDEFEIPSPEEDILAAWWCIEEEKEWRERSEEESLDDETIEFLNTPGENYYIFESLRKDEEEDRIKELNSMLDNCLTI